jgi:predicted signal transduction protein with EAL and GGDEF domain
VSSLAIYVVGFIILAGGLAYGASLAGLAPQWIAVGVLVLLGLGVATGVTRTRQRDPSHD